MTVVNTALLPRAVLTSVLRVCQFTVIVTKKRFIVTGFAVGSGSRRLTATVPNGATRPELANKVDHCVQSPKAIRCVLALCGQAAFVAVLW